MREIKFRGQMTTGEWVYGLPYEDKKGSTAYYDKCSFRIRWLTENGCANAPVKNGTIGQYTGLKDKNGKEVYDGDIRGGTYYCDNEQVSTLEVIEWDNDGMCFWWRRLKGGSMPDFIQTEIIGNIYEHKHLLNER